MATKAEIMESIKAMTVLELSELVKDLQEEFGVSAAAPVAAPAAGGGAAAPAVVEEAPTSFNVILTGAGEKKINVIKTVREVTALGLKEAKDLVESAPKAIAEGVTAEKAAELKAKFEGEGATIDVKPA
jgi:large subunit ribosomal protein L7/L12